MKRNRMCVYLDVVLSNWIKKNAMTDYRSFSSFLNKLMLEHKNKIESMSSNNILKSKVIKN